MEAGQKVEAFMTLTQNTKVTVFEPHMHAAAVRMCFDAIFGSRMETLSCSGYDHSWVRAYQATADFFDSPSIMPARRAASKSGSPFIRA